VPNWSDNIGQTTLSIQFPCIYFRFIQLFSYTSNGRMAGSGIGRLEISWIIRMGSHFRLRGTESRNKCLGLRSARTDVSQWLPLSPPQLRLFPAVAGRWHCPLDTNDSRSATKPESLLDVCRSREGKPLASPEGNSYTDVRITAELTAGTAPMRQDVRQRINIRISTLNS
jgi:hypothetical protein